MATPRLARALDTLGYLVQMIAWAVIATVYLPVIKDSDVTKLFLPSDHPMPAPTIAPHMPSPFEIACLALIVAIVIVLTIYALVTLPTRVRQSSDRVAKQVADSALDHLVHRPLPVRARRRLTIRIMYYLRAVAALVPIILAIVAPTTLPPAITLLITTSCGACSLILFSLAYWRASKH